MLVGYALINSEKNLIPGIVGQPKELAVFLAAEPSIAGTMCFMAWQMTSESLRDALVEKDLHAIRAIRESFASSSA